MSRAKPSSHVALTTFGQRLRAHRKDAGWTTQQVGWAVDVDQSLISMLENGTRRPSVHVLALLADLYGVSLDELWRGAPCVRPLPE